MTDGLGTLFERAQCWLDAARAAGWCDESDAAHLAAVERGTPGELFAEAAAVGDPNAARAAAPISARATRPLVVAFFGGTGVGKSSLLNRLAGAAVAATGVVRPTSRVATVYIHQAVALARLPADLPTDRTQVARHASDRYRDVLLIDMPDVDSTEQENRALALAWLPHVDLVIYVVSPERYRDDVGWRVLRERGARHGWLFVLNRWDEGDATQRDAVIAMLREAGFAAPLVVCTSCAPGAPPLPTPDELPQLESTIDALGRALAVSEFERLGQRARLTDLRRALEVLAARIGDEDSWEQVETGWRARLGTTFAAILEGSQWPIEMHAARFAQRDSGLVGALLARAANAVREPTGPTAASSSAAPAEMSLTSRPSGSDAAPASSAALPHIWDDWAQAKLASCLDALEVELRRREISALPVRRLAEPALRNTPATVNMLLADTLRARLGRPAGALRRTIAKAVDALVWLLPLAALGLVASQVVVGYFRAAAGTAPFLDASFALHSALLVLVAWCVPFTLGRALQPGLQRVAKRALQHGLSIAVENLQREMSAVLHECRADAAVRRAELSGLIHATSSGAVEPLRADLKRFVADGASAAAD